MTNILFICHGNICRSPMAEFIMKDIVEKAGVSRRFFIASAATSAEEIGNPVYPPAQRKLRKHGIDPSGKRAVRLRREDYVRYDYLIGMESANIRRILAITGGDPDAKLMRLLDVTAQPADIADPWYSGDFDGAWRDIERGCRALYEKLCREGSFAKLEA